MTRALCELFPISVVLLALPAASPAALEAWFVDSTTKVFGDDKPGDVRAARLTAAGNETEAVQLVIRAGQEALEGVDVQVGDLVSAEGARLQGAAVEVFRVAYVYLPAHDREYPDPLPPWTPCSIEAGQSQPAWLDIYVPTDAAPGVYRGTVTVTATGTAPLELPLELTVWNFSLPETPRSRCAFGIYTQGIEAQHQVTAGSAAYNALLARYCDMLLDHGATPRDLYFGLESEKTAGYLNDPRFNAFAIPYTEDTAELKRRVEYLRRRGWVDKGYFYVVDEPTTQEHYDLLARRAAQIHGIGADLRIVVPYFREPAFEAKDGAHGLLTGLCDIWCPKVSFYDEEFLTARQALGEEVWWYVCWEPGAPYANLYVDMAGIDHRALFWQQAHYNVQGFLYWTSTYWQAERGTADPWTDMATVKDLSATVYGDGSVLYPGAKVGVDGPVASVRLKLIREGLQDVEYLRLLQDKEGREAVRAVTAQVIEGPDAYSKDTARYLSLREAVGRRLSEGGR